MNISLSGEIAKQLEERVAQSSEFTSVQAYVEYVLGEVLKQTGGATAYNKPQEQAVKQRLQDLGYLD